MRNTVYLLCCISIFAVTPFLLTGQVTSLDSLELDIQLLQEDTFKIDVLNELAWEYKDINANKAFDYAQTAYSLSQKIGYKKGEALSLVDLGLYYKNKAQFDTSLVYLHKSLAVRKEMNDSLLIANAYINIALVNRKKGDYNLAKNQYLESTKYLNSEIKSHKKQLAKIYNGLGATARLMSNYDDAVSYLLQSLAIRQALKDSIGIAKTQFNLGALYHVMGRGTKALDSYNQAFIIFQKKGYNKYMADILNNKGGIELSRNNFPTALNYFNQALSIYRANHYTYNIGGIYNNMGLVYSAQENYNKAEEYFLTNLKIKSDSDDKRGLLEAKINIGTVYHKKKKYNQAESMYLQSLSLADSLNAHSDQIEIFSKLAELSADLNQFDKAYDYKIKYDSLRNHLISGLNTLASLEEEFATKKHQLEISKKEQSIQKVELANQTLALRNKQFIIFGQSILLVLGGLIFIMWRKNNKLKYKNIIAGKDAKLQQEQIETLLVKNELDSLSALIEGEEKERERISRDLHDRLGSLLSVTIMHFKTLTEHLNPNFKQQESLGMINELLSEACEEVRKIAKNISVGFLTKFGLVAALDRLIQTINETDQIKANLITHGLENRLGQDFEINIYRVIQELTGNILKHAKAQELEIQLIRNDTNLSIMIEDNGKGFDKSSLSESDGIGLINVGRRLQKYKGNYTIDSVIGRGTIVVVDLPIS